MPDAKTTRKRAPTKILPSAEYLRQCLDYDPDGGELVWRERPLSHFPNEQAWKMWNARFPSTIAGIVHWRGYRYIEINKVQYAAHRIACKIMTTDEPPPQIDHGNGERDGNRWLNLRAATHFDQAHNRRKSRNNTSGFNRVNQVGTRWRARLGIDGTVRHLGYFATREEAAAVYEKVARELYGEFFRQT